MTHVSYFAITNTRRPYRPVGIYQADRLQHMYVIGKTGTGKTTLLENLITQDIQGGRGCVFLDPHGDLAERLVRGMNEHDRTRLIYLDVAHNAGRYGYNPLRRVRTDAIPLAASGLLDTFRHHFGEKAWGARMEHIFRNVLYALLEYGEATLPDVLRILTDASFRDTVLAHITNTQVLYFFNEEYAKLSPRFVSEAIAPIQNKVGAYLTDPRIVRTLVTHTEDISFRKAMDDEHIIIVNLNRGVLGSDTAHLLGSLLVSTLTLAALSRTNIKEHERVPCFVYLDEFEHLLTGSVAGMLSEVRKMKVGVILAHQYLYQLPEHIKAAVLGNVGTLISFRIGSDDARALCREFEPVFTASDLLNLPNYDMCVKLLIQGEVSVPFSASGISPNRLPPRPIRFKL